MNDATPPQGHGPYAYAPPEPPKKKHTLRNVLLVLAALALAGIAGCAALLGSAAESVDDALDEEAVGTVLEALPSAARAAATPA